MFSDCECAYSVVVNFLDLTRCVALSLNQYHLGWESDGWFCQALQLWFSATEVYRSLKSAIYFPHCYIQLNCNLMFKSHVIDTCHSWMSPFQNIIACCTWVKSITLWLQTWLLLILQQHEHGLKPKNCVNLWPLQYRTQMTATWVHSKSLKGTRVHTQTHTHARTYTHL